MQTTLTPENKKSPLGDLGAEKTKITIIEDNQVIRDNVARFIRFNNK